MKPKTIEIDTDTYESMLHGMISYCAVCEYEWGIIWCINALLEYWGAIE